MSEARWDMAAVIIAIIAAVLSTSPLAITFVSALFLNIIRFIFPSSAQCERLRWMDIPEGPLHECTLNCPHATGPNPISEFFFLIKHGTAVRKPKQLDWRASYICTDTTVLKALLLLLNQRHSDSDSLPKLTLSWHPIGRHLTASFKMNNVPPEWKVDALVSVSKSELSRILQGYPPWYRTTLYLANGTEVPHPIRSVADLTRGGWIAAIGLSRTMPLMSHCMAVEPLDGKTGKQKLVHVASALDRILYRLGSLMTTFPEHMALIQEAQKLIRLVARETYLTNTVRMNTSLVYGCFAASSFVRTFGDDWFDYRQKEKRKFVKELSKEQCLVIMGVFAKHGKLMEVEVEGLRGCLLPALRAVLVGGWEVYDYVMSGRREVWESNLEGDSEKVVWLRVGDRGEDLD